MYACAHIERDRQTHVTVHDFSDLIISLGVLSANALAWRAATTSKRNGEKIEAGKADIRELTENTNSIKDALVKKTAEASEAKGLAAGLKQGRDEAAGK